MKPNRRLEWFIAVAAALLLCCGAAWVLLPGRRAVNAGTYGRIEPGTSRDEAERLLGGPGRTNQDFVDWLDNRTPATGAGTDLLNEHSGLPGIEYWYGDAGVIILRFDAEGRVADKQFLHIRVSTARQRVNRLLERFGWR